jgi:hypothetical protein
LAVWKLKPPNRGWAPTPSERLQLTYIAAQDVGHTFGVHTCRLGLMDLLNNAESISSLP